MLIIADFKVQIYRSIGERIINGRYTYIVSGSSLDASQELLTARPAAGLWKDRYQGRVRNRCKRCSPVICLVLEQQLLRLQVPILLKFQKISPTLILELERFVSDRADFTVTLRCCRLLTGGHARCEQ